MKRETPEELHERMQEAEKLVPRGRLIRHVKSGGQYVVRGHSLREDDLEALVNYSPRIGLVIVFSRPLKEVQDRFVLWNGQDWPTA